MLYRVGLAFAGITKDYLEEIAHETIDNLGRSKKAGLLEEFLFIDAESIEPYAHRLRDKIKTVGGLYHREEKFKGTGTHQKELFTWALSNGVDEAYYLEGDSKPGLVLPENMQLWQSVYRKDPTIDIVIPRRSRKSLQTFPIEQNISEIQGVNVAMNFIFSYDGYRGEHLDVAWGPKAVNLRALHYFTRTYHELAGKEVEITHWGHPFVALTYASHNRMRFGGIEIDTVHPPQRKQIEEGNPDAVEKRLRTAMQEIAPSLYHFIKLKLLAQK